MRLNNPLSSNFIRRWLPPFIYAFLLLSPFSIKIFNYDSHYIFEAPLLLSLILGSVMRDELFVSAVAAIRITRMSLLLVSFVMLIFVIGWLNTNNFGDAYGDCRASLIMLAGFAITKYAIKKSGGDWLIRLGLACAILYILFFFASAALDPNYLKFPSSYLALTVVSIIACWNKKITTAEIAVLLQFVLAAVSFYRQYWVAAILTALFVATYMVFQRRSVAKRSVVHIIMLLLVGGLPAYIFLGNHIAHFFSNSAHFYQLFGKSIAFLSAMTNGTGHFQSHDPSDALRFAYLAFLYKHPVSLLVPHGFGTVAVYGKIFPWYFGIYSIKANVIDSLIFYIAYCYGIITALLVFLWSLKCYLVYILRRGVIEASLLFLLLLLILAFDGGQISVILDAFWLGAFLALFSIPPRRTSDFLGSSINANATI